MSRPSVEHSAVFRGGLVNEWNGGSSTVAQQPMTRDLTTDTRYSHAGTPSCSNHSSADTVRYSTSITVDRLSPRRDGRLSQRLIRLLQCNSPSRIGARSPTSYTHDTSLFARLFTIPKLALVCHATTLTSSPPRQEGRHMSCVCFRPNVLLRFLEQVYRSNSLESEISTHLQPIDPSTIGV